MAKEWTPRGYVLDGVLGTGSSAQVWRAHRSDTGAPVALKCIRLGADDAPRSERLRRGHAEAQLLATLDHPNIVRLHDTVRTRHHLVLVLDLAERGSLRDLLAARRRLTSGEVVSALAPVAAALAHLHGRSVVHGDVSAANVLFGADGEPLLGDVGVARLVGDDRAVASTPIYVDPLVAAGRMPTPASDVFMLGAIAVHALTGDPLWHPAPTPLVALARAVGGVPRNLAARLAAAGAPQAVVDVVLRAVVDDPARRCSAVDLALDLRHSAPPVALEFAAGRDAAASVGADDVTDAVACGAMVEPVLSPAPALAQLPGRPEFARPALVPPSPGRPASPTVAAGTARVRPHIPRPPARGRVRHGFDVLHRPRPQRRPVPSGRHRGASRAHRGRATRVAGGVLAAVVAGVVVAVSATAGGTRPTAYPRRPVPSSPSSPSTSAAVPTVSRAAPVPWPSTSAAVALPSVGERAAWGAVLGRLDGVRAAAYARRRPALLTQVFAPGALLSADVARLRTTVPAGCGLRDVLTDFDVLAVSGTSTRATVVVSARLGASTLVCADGRSGGAAAAGPQQLRIEVVASPRGPRISAEQPV